MRKPIVIAGSEERASADTQPEMPAQTSGAQRLGTSEAPNSGRYRTSSEPAAPGVASTAPAGNRCSGLVFETTLTHLKEHFGWGLARNVRAALPQQIRATIDADTFSRDAWYPLEWYDALHVAARQVTGRGLDLPREIGRESTREDLTRGVHRIFLKILWPDLVLQKAPLIFGRYFERGALAIRAPEPSPFDTGGRKVVDATFTGCHGFTENVWQDVIGGCEGALLAVGARDVSITVTTGGTTGSPDCTGRAAYR